MIKLTIRLTIRIEAFFLALALALPSAAGASSGPGRAALRDLSVQESHPKRAGLEEALATQAPSGLEELQLGDKEDWVGTQGAPIGRVVPIANRAGELVGRAVFPDAKRVRLVSAWNPEIHEPNFPQSPPMPTLLPDEMYQALLKTGFTLQAWREMLQNPAARPECAPADPGAAPVVLLTDNQQWNFWSVWGFILAEQEGKIRIIRQRYAMEQFPLNGDQWAFVLEPEPRVTAVRFANNEVIGELQDVKIEKGLPVSDTIQPARIRHAIVGLPLVMNGQNVAAQIRTKPEGQSLQPNQVTWSVKREGAFSAIGATRGGEIIVLTVTQHVPVTEVGELMIRLGAKEAVVKEGSTGAKQALYGKVEHPALIAQPDRGSRQFGRKKERPWNAVLAGFEIPAAQREGPAELSSTQPIDEPELNAGHPFGAAMRALVDDAAVTPASRARIAALREIGPEVEEHARQVLGSPEVRIAMVPLGSTLRGYAAADSDVDYNILILTGEGAPVEVPGSAAAQIARRSAELLEEKGFHPDPAMRVVDVSHIFAEAGAAAVSPYKVRIANELLAKAFLPVAHGDAAAVRRTRKAVLEFLWGPTQCSWRGVSYHHRRFVGVDPWGAPFKPHLRDWLSRQGVDAESTAAIRALNRGRGAWLPHFRVMAKIHSVPAVGLEEGSDDPQLEEENPFGEGLRALVRGPWVTEESKRRMRALREIGPRLERYVQEVLGSRDVRIAIIPLGSTLRGYAARESDVDYNIILLETDGSPAGLTIEKHSRIIRYSSRLLGGGKHKLHADPIAVEVVNFPSVIQQASPRDQVLMRDRIAKLFLPIAYGDAEAVERTRQAAMEFVQRSAGRSWPGVSRHHRMLVGIHPEAIPGREHLGAWLTGQGVDPGSSRAIRNFNRRRGVYLPDESVMLKIYPPSRASAALEELVDRAEQLLESSPGQVTAEKAAVLSEMITQAEKILAERERPDLLRPTVQEIESQGPFKAGAVVFLPEEDAEAVFITDLHGDYGTLERVLAWPAVKKRYRIFGGDFVDGGPRSLDVLLRVFAEYLRDPERNILMAGNIDRDRLLPDEEGKFRFYRQLEALGEEGLKLYAQFQQFARRSLASVIVTKTELAFVHAGPPSVRNPNCRPEEGLRWLAYDESARHEMSAASLRRPDGPDQHDGSEEENQVGTERLREHYGAGYPRTPVIGMESFDAFQAYTGAKFLLRGHDSGAPADRAAMGGRVLTVHGSGQGSPETAYPRTPARVAVVQLNRRYTTMDPQAAPPEEQIVRPVWETAGLEEMGRSETPTQRRAVLIGGVGNIGRGHIAALLAADDFDIIFADFNQALIAEANQRDSYVVTPVGVGQPVTVRNFWGIDARDTEAVAAQGPRADWVFTTVGTGNIIKLTDVVYRYIRRRIEAGHLQTLNIVFAENLPVDQPQIAALRQAVLDMAEDAATRKYVEQRVNFIGSGQFRSYVDGEVGWVGAVVNITVPPTIAAKSENPLDIAVEGGGPYYLEVDAKELRDTGFIPSGLRPVENIRAAREKKLLIHNMGHATLAYLCAALGITDPAVGMKDARIAKVVRRAMTESAQGLHHRYPDLFPRGELDEYIAELADRFGNAELGDTVERIARDPMRKLQENDRLFGAAQSASEAGVAPEAIGLAIAAAIRYAREVDKIGEEDLAPILDLVRKHGLKLPDGDPAFQAELDRLSGLEEGSTPAGAAPGEVTVERVGEEVFRQRLPGAGWLEGAKGVYLASEWAASRVRFYAGHETLRPQMETWLRVEKAKLPEGVDAPRLFSLPDRAAGLQAPGLVVKDWMLELPYAQQVVPIFEAELEKPLPSLPTLVLFALKGAGGQVEAVIGVMRFQDAQGNTLYAYFV